SVPIRVRSSFRGDDDAGTLITRVERMEPIEGMALTGLASERGHARLTLRGLPATMEATTRALERFAATRVSLDMVAPVDRRDGARRDLQLTLKEEALVDAERAARELVGALGGEGFDVKRGLTRVAVVGSGMHDRPGVYALEFQALERAGVSVHALSSSGITIRVLVDAAQEDAALRALHDAFGLGETAR
ncbi:MAG TPA: ACT domain-containing protein, partial [Longimicrobiales bacterium]|nr:ACT domain-containing protein [Longimicrobiales bacterium]